MTDQVESVDVSSDVAAPVTQDVSPQAAPEAQAAETPPVPEKLIPQSQVNKIVARESRDAAAKAEARFRQEMSQSQAVQQPQTLGGMIQITPEQLEQQILQTAQRLSQRQMADQIANEFERSIMDAKTSDPEFADKYAQLQIEDNPHLILWMRGMDNKADVIRDLADNPAKFANVLMLANSGKYQLAELEMQKLSTSIKQNKTAQGQKTAHEPLDQMKPSTISTDNGSSSVADFRKIFRS